MIYRSNLTAPNLLPHFRHAHSRVQGHSFGHDVISDWADRPDDDPVFGLYKQCGFWTHDEAAILYNIASTRPGLWCDIGAHTGWTSAHIAAAGQSVVAIEPMLRLEFWQRRLEENLNAFWPHVYESSYLRSVEYLNRTSHLFAGVVIDGDHMHPNPLLDATLADVKTQKDNVILFHDAMGGPVWRGIQHLIAMGHKCKMYSTPHMIACCWRGDWQPPEHTPDPAIDWNEIRTNHMKEFPWDKVIA